MVMEALDGYNEKFKFEIYGHSGEESALPLVKLNEVFNFRLFSCGIDIVENLIPTWFLIGAQKRQGTSRSS